MTALKNGEEVTVTLKGTVVTGSGVDSHFAGYGSSSFGFYGRPQEDWIGVRDAETGIVHLFWKDVNPVKRTTPDNYPPQNGDVWEVNGEKVHVISGTGYTGTTGYRGTAKDKIKAAGADNAKLLFRESKAA